VSAVFETSYAGSYDLLYQDKDYVAECDVLEKAFQTYAEQRIENILDLGCGTGSHALVLAQRGYQVVGVDRSSGMLAQAHVKAAQQISNGEAVFQRGDIRNLNLDQRFDAVLIMFAVLGYQLSNSDVRAALQSARRHLNVGGLLAFDVWYGPAVTHERPTQRVKVIPTPEGKIVRVASGELDTSQQVCAVHYQLWHIGPAGLIAECEEDHQMRYFFPLELNLFLQQSGFTLLRLSNFPELDREPDETTWNVLGVARAI